MRLHKLLVLSAAAPWAAAQYVTGIKAGVNEQTGERPARLNINDMHRAAGPAWDLFIQALQAVFDTPEDNLLSWYQTSGIHGLPFKPYNGVENGDGNAKAGYCPHGQLTFITWHRPYVTLIEQSIQAQAQKIAALYPSSSSAAYKAAALTLRFPYWDWATDAQLPPIITEPTITITTPSGSKTIRNPLYSYQFQNFPFTDEDMLNYPKVAQFNETKRCADSEIPSDGVNHYEIIRETLGDQATKVRDATYAVFAKTTNFVDMASEAGKGGGGNFENPHNVIHQHAGGHPRLGSKLGHIQPAEWSAFDPLFFLHHAQVDRLWALWQAIYPNQSMFTGTVPGEAVFGTPNGDVTPDTPLKPFQKDKNTFWTNKMTESTRPFGYTYPGLEDWKYSKDELSKRTIALVNGLYGKPAAATRARGLRRRADNSTLTDYAVRIAVDRADLPVPCSIEVRIGDVVAGEYALLSMPKTGSGSASIPLQRALQGAGVVVDGRTAEEVVAELEGKMKIAVRKMGEEATIPTEGVASLKVEIEERDVTPATKADEFPKFGELKTLPVDVKKLSG